MRRRALEAGTLAALVLAGAGIVGAAEGEKPPVRVQMEPVEIQGEVERPEVFYIIPRREAPLDLGPQTRDYREEILEPLDRNAFEAWMKARKGAAASHSPGR